MVSAGLTSGNLVKKHKEPTVHRLSSREQISE